MPTAARTAARVGAAVAAVGAGGFAWGLAEAAMFRLRRHELAVLPAGSEPIRVLHVSDIHATARQHTKLDFVRQLAGVRPDLVVNTGDNIADPRVIEPLMSAFGQLRFVPGVYVWGSNDYYAPRFKNPLDYILPGSWSRTPPHPKRLPTDRLKAEFDAVGWHDLTHTRTTLEIKGLRIEFRGTDDAHLERDDYSLIAGAPAEGVDVSVGVTHAPYLRLLDAMADDRLDLILAGHTHGGQVCVPGYGALVTNCDLDTDRVKGPSTHTHGGHTSALHVSGGVGTSPYAPYRFACRPEASLLTLVPR